MAPAPPLDTKFDFTLLNSTFNDSFIGDYDPNSPPMPQHSSSLSTAVSSGRMSDEFLGSRLRFAQYGEGTIEQGTPVFANGGLKLGTDGEEFSVMGLKQREKLMDELKKDNFELKLKVYYLQDTLAKTTPESYEKTVNEVTHLKEQNSLLVSEISRIQSDYEQKWQDLQTNISAKHSQELGERGATIRGLEAENGILSEKLIDKEHELVELSEHLESTQSDLLVRENDIRDLEHLNADLETQRHLSLHSLAENEEQLRRAMSECEKLKAELRRVKDEREKTRAESARWRDEYRRAREEKKALFSECSLLKAEVEDVKGILSTVEQERDLLRRRYSDLEQEKRDLHKEAERSNDRMNDRISKLNRRHDQETARLQQRNMRLQEELDRTRRELTDKSSQNRSALSSEMDALRNSVATKEAENKELRNEIRLMHGTLETIATSLRTGSTQSDYRLNSPATSTRQGSEKLRNLRAIENTLSELQATFAGSNDLPPDWHRNLTSNLARLAGQMSPSDGSNPGSPALSVRSTSRTGTHRIDTVSLVGSSPGPITPGSNDDMDDFLRRMRLSRPSSNSTLRSVHDEDKRRRPFSISSADESHQRKVNETLAALGQSEQEIASLKQRADLIQHKFQHKAREIDDIAADPRY
ncbi:hypothetical protein BJ742DRAFT_795049 [Cladochytrium replicatum]|nr:hypothetical protein BJ742DRAFT_795049 [Cladochytrium replicatum]